jgi:Secretion system C-terminal sorting domain
MEKHYKHVKSLFLFGFLSLTTISQAQVVNWATATGLSLGSTLVNGQIINNFAGTGINMRINCVVVSGFPKISATNSTVIDITNANAASFTLTALNGTFSPILTDHENLQSGEVITISNPNNKPIQIIELTTNGNPRPTIDGTPLTGTLPLSFMGDASVIVREKNDGIGTSFRALMNDVSSFTWQYTTDTGVKTIEGFKMEFGVALPTELVSFDAVASKDQSNIDLNWETAFEHQNKGFYILRSQDALAWETLDFVPITSPIYTSNTYQYLDEQPLIGTSYYQIEQLDINGKITKSPIRSVYISKLTDAKLTAWPNPTVGNLSINGQHITEPGQHITEPQLRIYDVIGQDVTNKATQSDLGNGQWELDLSALNTGMYQIRSGATSLSIMKL